ncbi:MAG: hypothetical protein WCJ59_02500 [bacterium]
MNKNTIIWGGIIVALAIVAYVYLKPAPDSGKATETVVANPGSNLSTGANVMAELDRLASVDIDAVFVSSDYFGSLKVEVFTPLNLAIRGVDPFLPLDKKVQVVPTGTTSKATTTANINKPVIKPR